MMQEIVGALELAILTWQWAAIGNGIQYPRGGNQPWWNNVFLLISSFYLLYCLSISPSQSGWRNKWEGNKCWRITSLIVQSFSEMIDCEIDSISSPKHLDFRSTPELTPVMGGLSRALHMLTHKTFVVLFAPTATFNFQPFSKAIFQRKKWMISRPSWGNDSIWNHLRSWLGSQNQGIGSLTGLSAASSTHSWAPAGRSVFVCG